jgi:hypothetical protein
MLRVIFICFLAQGCAVALPLAGVTGTARSEYRYQKLEKRVIQMEEIIDFLIEEKQK